MARVVSAARQLLCPDVSVFDQRDRTPLGTMNSYVRHQAHARQFTRPNWERLSRISARCVAVVAFCLFALMRRPPTSDIPIAVCRVAFAHVIADHRRPGSWSLDQRSDITCS